MRSLTGAVALSVLTISGPALAGWGDDAWGTMVWGLPVSVPAVGWLGLGLLALGLAATAAWTLRKQWSRAPLLLASLLCTLLAVVGPARGDEITIPSGYSLLNGDLLGAPAFLHGTELTPDIHARFQKGSGMGATIPDENSINQFTANGTEVIFDFGIGEDEDVTYKTVIRWQKGTVPPSTGIDDAWDVATFYDVNYRLQSGELRGFNQLKLRLEGIHEVGPHGTTLDPPNNRFGKNASGKGDVDLATNPAAIWVLTLAFKSGHGRHKDDIRHTTAFLVQKECVILQILPSQTFNALCIPASSPGGSPAIGGNGSDAYEPSLTVHPNSFTEIVHTPRPEVSFRVPDVNRLKALTMNAEYASLDIGGSHAVSLFNLSVASAQDENGDDVPLGTATELIAAGDTFDNPHSALFTETEEDGVYELAVPLGEEIGQWTLEKTAATGDSLHLGFAIEDLELTPTATGYTGSGEVALSLFTAYAIAYPTPFLGNLLGQHLDPNANGFAAFVTLTDDGSGSGGSAVIDLTGYEVEDIGVPMLTPFSIAMLLAMLMLSGLFWVPRRGAQGQTSTTMGGARAGGSCG